MNAMQKVFNQLVDKSSTTNTKNSISNQHVCQHCGEVVPVIEVEVLGIKRLVQPDCECEVNEKMKSVYKAQERMEKRKLQSLFSVSKMGSRLESSTFANFKMRPGTEKAVSEAKRYVDNFNDNQGIGLMMFGATGAGKSHLAAAITHELLAKGHTVVFQAVPDLLERIRSTFNKNSQESEQQIMKALLSCDLLVLDDIGSERVTGWVYEVFFRIVDGRYRNERPIVYTSNLTPKELEQRFSEFEDSNKITNDRVPRILDRITETSDFIKVDATSYRKELARERIERKRGIV